MTQLFAHREECIEALQPEVEVLPINQRNEHSRLMTKEYPISINGRIDWAKVGYKQKVNSCNEIISVLQKHFDSVNLDVLIIWDGAHLPVLKSNLSKILMYIDDVTAVGFDIWLFCPEQKYVIEFYHEDEITVAYL